MKFILSLFLQPVCITVKEKDDPYKIAKDFANRNDLKTEAIGIIASQIYRIQRENIQSKPKKLSFSRVSKDGTAFQEKGDWSPEFALSKLERNLVEASKGSFSEPKKRKLNIDDTIREVFIQIPKSQIVKKVVFRSSENLRE